MADNDIRMIDESEQFSQPEPVFVNENDDDSDLLQDRRRMIETNQILGERFDPLYNSYDSNYPVPILFSDKRIDVKKPGPRIDVSSQQNDHIFNMNIPHFTVIQFPTPKIEILDQQDVSTPGVQSNDGLIKSSNEQRPKEKTSIPRKKKIPSKINSNENKLIRLRLKSSHPEVVPFIDESGKRSMHLTKSSQAIEVNKNFLHNSDDFL